MTQVQEKSQYLLSLRSPVVELSKKRLLRSIVNAFKQLKVTLKELKNSMITMINQIENLNKDIYYTITK